MIRPLRNRAPEVREAGSRLQHRAVTFEIRATGENGEVEGYGSVFGTKDSYDDIVAPGAFAASLNAHKADGTLPAMLWQHNPDEPIGVWTEMAEDEKGLKVKGKLALDTVKGREAFSLMKMGALKGLSIGFVSKQWVYDRQTDIRTLTEIDLWEVSVVTFPANGKATVTNVKTDAGELAAPKDAERTLREAGFSKSDATAFVSRVMRMGEERREAAQSTAQAMKAAERLLSSLTTP